MSTMDWVEERLEKRRSAVRHELQARALKARRKHRQKVRGLARAALAVTLLALGILAVEIGRKAIIVMDHAQAVERTIPS